MASAMTPREPDRFDAKALELLRDDCPHVLREARAWIDKHKCCTEERRALVAKIDEALDARTHLRASMVPEIPSADAQAGASAPCASCVGTGVASGGAQCDTCNGVGSVKPAAAPAAETYHSGQCASTQPGPCICDHAPAAETYHSGQCASTQPGPCICDHAPAAETGKARVTEAPDWWQDAINKTAATNREILARAEKAEALLRECATWMRGRLRHMGTGTAERISCETILAKLAARAAPPEREGK